MNLEELAFEAEKLPDEQKKELLERLVVLLDGDSSFSGDHVEKAWEGIVDQRIEQIDSDEVVMMPSEEVLARLRAKRRETKG